MSAAEVFGEPVGSWERTTSVCGECATTFAGHGCPCCGELAEASPVIVFGFVTEAPDDGQLWLDTATTGPEGLRVVGSRLVTAEQVAWLRRGSAT